MMRSLRKVLLFFILGGLGLGSHGVWADDTDTFAPQEFSLHFQATLLPDYHGSFPAQYSGPFSLKNTPELNASFTTTFFAGWNPWSGGFLYANPEVSAGSGFSGVDGLADLPNGEISKVGSPDPTPNLARIYVQQVFGFGGDTENIDDDQNQVAVKQDISRLTLTLGKFSLNDFFDNNAYAHDARTQFINLGLVDNLAWDYAADTHGYTWGAMAELNQKDWALRFCSAMMSTVANGPLYDANLSQARADNAELEWRYSLDSHPGRVRLLAYINHARMGSYADALASGVAPPVITQSAAYREKVGFGLNFEQELAANLGGFLRLGWNDGQTESFELTAVDETASLGAVLKNPFAGRPDDQVGLGFIISGLSSVHEAYLAAGGTDFLLGDGALDYGPERVAEIYYLFKVNQPLALTLDLQGVNNPAYNQARGPVGIVSGRIHMEL